MIKIPTLFVMDYSVRPGVMTGEITPGCEWVLAGQGVATVKFDGTACMCKDGIWYQRYDAKKGRTPPPGAIPCCDPDPITGHHPHWLLIGEKSEIYRQMKDAIQHLPIFYENGTYELCGPKVGGNKHHLQFHQLLKHGDVTTDGLYSINPKTREEILAVLSLPEFCYEGIVFYHRDGRMCKIRKDHFGLPW